ncbi:MAG: putative RNA-binding protein (virulence factor B family) [Halieaceae bacterium]|jgi:predicted RNA-binding protein (virulence factor B family)
MISVGQTHELTVVNIVDFGVYLDAENLGEVLLPRRYVPEGAAVGDRVTVFLYFDSEDRLIATTQRPKAKVGEYAYLQVTDINDFGAFLDWGLDKDLLVPFAEQHRPMHAGHSYLVYLYINQADGRIVASSTIDRFVEEEAPQTYNPQQAVDLIVANSTELGYKAIINHSHWGVLYKDEVFQRLSFGQSIKGYIKNVRSDGKIDLTLQGGQEVRDKYSRAILGHLRQQNGFAAVHDKSAPELISRLFGMSKKSFKKAIGGLYKARLITIEKDGIRLAEPQTPEHK